MRIRYVVAGGILVIGGLATAGSGGSSVSNSTVSTTASSSPNAAGGSTATTKASSTAHVGSTVAVSDGSGGKANVTLSQVIDPASGADQFTTPDAGKRFVGVELTIANTGSKSLSDDANSTTSVQGSDNQSYTADFSNISECTNFNAGSYTLAPGASVTGCVTFQVPTAVTVKQIQFQPTGFTGGVTGQWQVP
jgi:hypothetical protein